MAILKLYKDKTKLKDIESEYVNYMISKNMLNAGYGMMVTDIVRDEILYEDDEYSTKTPGLEEAIEKYNKSKTAFYSIHGVFGLQHMQERICLQESIIVEMIMYILILTLSKF